MTCAAVLVPRSPVPLAASPRVRDPVSQPSPRRRPRPFRAILSAVVVSCTRFGRATAACRGSGFHSVLNVRCEGGTTALLTRPRRRRATLSHLGAAAAFFVPLSWRRLFCAAAAPDKTPPAPQWRPGHGRAAVGRGAAGVCAASRCSGDHATAPPRPTPPRPAHAAAPRPFRAPRG